MRGPQEVMDGMAASPRTEPGIMRCKNVRSLMDSASTSPRRERYQTMRRVHLRVDVVDALARELGKWVRDTRFHADSVANFEVSDV